MSRVRLALVGVAAWAFAVGCRPLAAPPKAANAPFAEVQLGAPFEDARGKVEGAGEEREYDALPATPKPRDVYPKLPADATWRLWSGEGKPTLILGVVGGKVAYRQVVWSDGGRLKSEASALPEFQ